MKLYYAPGACSLSVHIALHESGLAFDTIQVATSTKTLPDGSHYLDINPLGYVPCLELSDGERLLEGPAIVQYIADQVPEKHLAPPNGTPARYRLQSWLNFIAMELHRGFAPLLMPDASDALKAATRERLLQRFAWLNGQLDNREYLMGDAFTVADGYAFVVTGWAAMAGIDMSRLTHLALHRARIGARPKVQAALRAEGLI
jgi:glutathione S-transferase